MKILIKRGYLILLFLPNKVSLEILYFLHNRYDKINVIIKVENNAIYILLFKVKNIKISNIKISKNIKKTFNLVFINQILDK